MNGEFVPGLPPVYPHRSGDIPVRGEANPALRDKDRFLSGGLSQSKPIGNPTRRDERLVPTCPKFIPTCPGFLSGVLAVTLLINGHLYENRMNLSMGTSIMSLSRFPYGL